VTWDGKGSSESLAVVCVAGSGEGVPQDRGARMIADVVHRRGSAASSIELTAFASQFRRLGVEIETRAIECQAK